MLNGIRWRVDLFQNLDVSKAIFSHISTYKFDPNSLPIVYVFISRNTCCGKKALRLFLVMIFWQSHETKKKYRLTKWSISFHPKYQGGLGIEVLELKKSIFT
jgi:hypothetical protein